MVFFSSYRMMEETAEAFTEILETEENASAADFAAAGMTERNGEAFLIRFEETPPEGLIKFCVMGGIFSEADGSEGEQLISAIVVNPGLPSSHRERSLKNFYDARGEDGFFFYAYLCPGMNKVLQSAGR